MSSILSLPAYILHLIGPGHDQYLPEPAATWIGPSYTLGQLTGGLIAAYLGDWLGRKLLMGTGAFLIDVSIALLIWSPNLGTVIFARILEGISIGFLLLGYQCYTAEVAEKQERGFLSGLSLITGNCFSLAASAITYGIVYANGDWGWRLALSITMIPATLLIIVLPWIPESPRWLYLRGKREKARENFIRLHAECDGKLSKEAEEEWEELRLAIEYELKHNAFAWRNLFMTPTARYRTFVAMSSQFIWAWNGSRNMGLLFHLCSAECRRERCSCPVCI